MRGQVRGSGVMAWVAGGKCHSGPVRFQDASNSGAGMFVPVDVPVGQTVWLVLDDGADYRGVTRYCLQEQRGFRVGVRTIAEKRRTSIDDPKAGFTMKWIDSLENLRLSTVSLVRDQDSDLAVIAEQRVPCPSIVLLASDEDLCLAYGSECVEKAPYRLQIRILPDTYVSY